VVGDFVSGPVRIGDNDLQIGNIEGEVIIAAVPQDDIHFFFRLA